MLEVRNLVSGYGATAVLFNVSVELRPAEVVAVLGSNGAGKTTLLRTISGLVRGSRGTIALNGKDILDSSPAEILRSGIAHVPEARRIFPGLTVAENLDMGAFTIGSKIVRADNLAIVFELFPRLKERRSQIGTTLSGGEQQMLAVGRALMSSPRYLLLDEPSMGLAPIVIERLFVSLKKLRQHGLGIMLVEQNAHVGLDVADRFIILSRGSVVNEGVANEGVSIDQLMSAYLAD